MYGAGGQKRVPDSFVRDFAAALPSIEEQSQVTTFLNHETAKIDALIAEQQRLIKLLQEKRQAVISNAVTKGLNPNAPMKDSGVEWLGEVPEHWEIMDLAKTTLLLQTGPFGSQLGTADYKGEGVAVINPSNISEGSIDASCGPFITMSKALELERHKLHKGDLVIARRGEMGRCAVVKDGKEEKLCGTGSILLRPLVWMCTDFMAHIIRSDDSRASLSLNSVGSTMENLSAAIVGKLRIPVPPRDEQVQIVDWIRSIASSYQSLAHNSVRAIELLQERRSALISAAVTDQIDVRGVVEAEGSEQ
jgi:type I restriction enzyme S subunit